LLREDAMWGDPMDESESEDQEFDDAAIAASTRGVAPAAALFKQPTEKSKKYSRPVMSKIFTSLGVDAMEFLEIQAAAKKYMEDPAHPERRATVGYARYDKNETDTAKLNLANVTESFLEEEGWGERTFGPNARGRTSAKIRWPKNKSKVINAVTPLLRRMVTNLRQREYQAKIRLEKKTAIVPRAANDEGLTYSTPATIQASHDTSQVASPSIVDPGMTQYIYNIRLNVIQNGHRIMSVLNLKQTNFPNYSTIVQCINTLPHNILSVEVLGPNGLLSISNEDNWKEVIALIAMTEWMDGEVKCVVEV